jgi:hypothetical protein
MPTVATLPGRVSICQYHKDHDPPHFHVLKKGGGQTRIRIADLVDMDGSLAGGLPTEVIPWAADHKAELALNYILAKAGLDLLDIPYP